MFSVYSKIIFALLFGTLAASGQVGVGTTSPQAALDVVSSTNGILVPRVALISKNLQAPIVNPQALPLVAGTLVWNTATSGLSPNNVVPGFYYWSGSAWVEIGSGATSQWALLGNAGTTPGTNFIGTTDAQDLRLAAGAGGRFNIGNATGQFSSLSLGSAGSPTYSWYNDLNTGLFSPVADNLGLTTAGTERVRIEADGDVGIGITPVASAKLQISATDRGLLIPNVALTAKNAAGPVTAPATSLLVYNTATAGISPNNVVPGFHYWNGSAWVALTGLNSNDWGTTGNSGTSGGTTSATGTNFIGTTDSNYLNFRTNNNVVGRFSPLGEFFVGSLNTVISGDLMNAVSNASFPWAINGYSSFNGGGIYGQVMAGTNTTFGAVQGEYSGIHAQGAGVRGMFLGGLGGTSFGGVSSGVSGNATTAGSYKFGVWGSGGTSVRSGGIIGYDYGIAAGALGYYSSGGTDYSVYGFGLAYTTGAGAGRPAPASSAEKNTNIGLGIYGGAMGGWVRGLRYGFHTKGETYSLYVDGNGYVNKPLTYLVENPSNGERTPAYMATGTRPEMTSNGKTLLSGGKIFVPFDKSFSSVISNANEIVITATPQGKSNGVYVDNITRDGFWIYENNDGLSNVKISWIAVTAITGQEKTSVPADLLAGDFDKKMDGVMFNENNKSDAAQSLWWDGSKMRWDRPENTKADIETDRFSRPKEAKR